ncbi:MAG: ankyrin repeat domain-containing protein [Planctomycetota bacterium]
MNPTRLVQLLQQGPLPELIQALDDTPRAIQTFLNQPRPHGGEQWLPLHFAAAAGYAAAVDLLLDRGAKPDVRTRYRTPMHARATPLHLAAAAGHADVVKRLLQANAETEVRDASQRSPLWLAASHHHPDVVSQLLAAGTDVEARDTQQRSPLHAALLPPKPGPERNEGPDTPPSNDRPHLAGSSFDFNAALAVLLPLLAAGADPNATCPKEPAGYTPLHRCITLGDPAFPIAQALLAADADPTLADPRHARTPHALAEHLGRDAYRLILPPP